MSTALRCVAFEHWAFNTRTSSQENHPSSSRSIYITVDIHQLRITPGIRLQYCRMYMFSVNHQPPACPPACLPTAAAAAAAAGRELHNICA